MSDFEPEAFAVRPPGTTPASANGAAHPTLEPAPQAAVAKKSPPSVEVTAQQDPTSSAKDAVATKKLLSVSAAEESAAAPELEADSGDAHSAKDEDDLSGGNLEADEQMLGTSEEDEEDVEDDEEDMSAVNDILAKFVPQGDEKTGEKANSPSPGPSDAAAVAVAGGASLAAAGLKPVKDCKLELALNNEEPTVRNLILAAIGVMKNRKARPDTKRICNWIHRRYGQPYGSVSEELERLVESGELAKVEYKGSVSFRIINPLGKTTKRRRRGTKPLGRTPSKQQMLLPIGAMPAGAALPPMLPTNDGPNSAPISLRTLVCDLQGDVMGAGGINVTYKSISKAVETTQRNVSKTTVLGNLDLILEKEVQVGHFVKTGPNSYYVPPLAQGTSNMSAVALPQGPQMQHDLTGMQSQQQQHHHQQTIANLVPKTEPLDLHQQQQSGLLRSFSVPAMQHQQQPSPAPQDKTEEERKNDLIQEKLFKMKDNAKGKSPGKKLQQPTKDPLYLTLREKKLAEIAKKKQQQQLLLQQDGDDDAWDLSKSSKAANKKVKKRLIKEAKMKNLTLQQQQQEVVAAASGKTLGGRKRKREAWTMDGGSESGKRGGEELDMDLGGAASPQAMRGSLRKKKSRKIFDPADHEAPSRKRKVSSPTPPMLLSAADQQVADMKPLLMDNGAVSSPNPPSLSPALPPQQAGLLLEPKKEPLIDACKYCGFGVLKKNGKNDTLLKCKDCATIVHPSCMDYTDELTRKILTASWQCINCKTCSLCEDGNDDELMLFCDACDLGYHMRCHRPPVTHKPAGRWECYQCKPIQAITRTTSRTQSNDYYSENSYSITSSRRSSANNSQTLTNGFHGAASSSHPASVAADVSKFLPLLPPPVHPKTGELPEHWEETPVDPSIPDCRNWSPIQVMTHFQNQGFQNGQVSVFLKEEIDGRSLLMLHRQDVLTTLGLKLGPALKVFSHVQKLQTRRNLPE